MDSETSGQIHIRRKLLAGRASDWSAILRKPVARVYRRSPLFGDGRRLARWTVRFKDGSSQDVRIKHTTQEEVQVYRELQDQIPLALPEILFTDLSDRNDLADRNSLCIYAGLPAGKPSLEWSLADELGALGDLAKLHAAFWEMQVGSSGWLRPLQETIYADLKAARRGVRLLRQIGGWHGIITEDRLTLMEVLLADPSKLLAAVDKLPVTLLHGDPWQPNWIILGDRRVLLDWQTACVGPAIWDVVYFLEMSGEGGGALRIGEEEAVRAYLDALECALNRPLGAFSEDFRAAFEPVSLLQTLIRWPLYACDYLFPLETYPFLARFWLALPGLLRAWLSNRAAWAELEYYRQTFERFEARARRFINSTDH